VSETHDLFSLRIPGVRDIPAICAIELEVFGSHKYPDFFFRQALDLWPTLCWVSEAPSKALQGYVLGASGSIPGEMWILSLGVRYVFRGHGIAQALLERALAEMAHQGAQEVKLTVNPHNGAAQLYQKVGFQMLSHEPEYFGPDEPRWVMGLHLST
jgi:ribosomal-protein-alanine N-acetyltransferase